jgi:predicted Zn-dependent protease with MMP-like domain
MILGKKEFDDLVSSITSKVISSLPDDLREQAETVLIVTADRPSKTQMEFPGDDDLLGLYEGVPLNERRVDESPIPDTITIFRKPLLEMCRNARELRAEIRITLIHELGHFYGFDEDELAERGLE